MTFCGAPVKKIAIPGKAVHARQSIRVKILWYITLS